MRKVLSKVQKIRAITAFHQKFEANLGKIDALANKIYKAFENPATKFSRDELKKIATQLDTVSGDLAKNLQGCLTNLRVSVAAELPTNRVVAHIEDGHTLLSKIAILRSQAMASVAAEEDISIDESGQLVDSPMEDIEETTEEEKTPEEIQQDIHEDLDELVGKLKGEEAPIEDEPAEPVEASKKASKPQVAAKSKELGSENPDMPKENPGMKEVSDVKKLKDEYEKEPTQKNAKKKSEDSKTSSEVAEENPDMPKENPGMKEESLEELVDDYEASPSDPENLEMEDSMIDDAVNTEILSDGDVDAMEDSIVSGSTATLRDRKLASSRKVSASNPVSEDDVMKDLVTSMFEN